MSAASKKQYIELASRFHGIMPVKLAPGREREIWDSMVKAASESVVRADDAAKFIICAERGGIWPR